MVGHHHFAPKYSADVGQPKLKAGFKPYFVQLKSILDSFPSAHMKHKEMLVLYYKLFSAPLNAEALLVFMVFFLIRKSILC